MTERTTSFRRRAGVLLHPTSLPGPDGIGDLGPEAYRWLDWLTEHGQSLWQVLPLGPTSYGDSPYQTLSSFAGNPLLVSLERLRQRGWLDDDDLAARPRLPADRVDYGAVIAWKTALLDRAAGRLGPRDRAELAAWAAAHEVWLPDWCLFAALKEEQEGRPWTEWPAELRDRDAAALARARERLADRLAAHRFRQWQFAVQWDEVKLYAQAHDVAVKGDVPIFTAHDSCDVWAERALFRLDGAGRPTHVAGVPPDYFSATGQLWGNPLYDWERSAADGHRWWIARLRAALDRVDILRLDHFRGFEAYWEVPADAETAEAGRWRPGPGSPFLASLREALGGLPLVAEDLGVITPAVEALRDEAGLPGMKVLQFAWDGPANAFLPHRHRPNSVVYTGTHDNDPTVGWWEHRASPAERALVAEYVGGEVHEPHWTLIRLGMLSCAHTFVCPLQDVLGLGREARMNLPGEGAGNWSWRLPRGMFTDPAGARLARLTWLGARRPDQTRSRPAAADPAEDAR